MTTAVYLFKYKHIFNNFYEFYCQKDVIFDKSQSCYRNVTRNIRIYFSETWLTVIYQKGFKVCNWVSYTKNMPDYEMLMDEWKPDMEQSFKQFEFPGPEIDMSVAD